MLNDVLQHIVGIEIYPIVALLIFVVAFAAIALWAILQDKSKVTAMSHMPLEDDDPATQNGMGA